jgi:hypothetical protein
MEGPAAGAAEPSPDTAFPVEQKETDASLADERGELGGADEDEDCATMEDEIANDAMVAGIFRQIDKGVTKRAQVPDAPPASALAAAGRRRWYCHSALS